MSEYKKRIADEILRKRLGAIGAVLIEGPKWCGKTTTAMQQANSILFMQDSSNAAMINQMADIGPKLLLEGDTPRLLDEWQVAPELWDAVRFEVDMRNAPGQFILTGSAVPMLKSTAHTGTGRIWRMTMRPMSLYESGDSTGEVSLEALFLGEFNDTVKNKLDFDDISYLICRGGWPMAMQQTKEDALMNAYAYYDGIVNSDLSRADGVLRNPQNVDLLLRSYARMIGSQSTLTNIRADMKIVDEQELDINTVRSYIETLKKIFVVEELSGWNPNIRSKNAIRTSPTRYFVDPSIAVAALNLGPGNLANDLNTMGFFFENMCIRDLRVYADGLNGSLYKYRDKYGLECDAVLTLRNGQYALIEIKLGGTKAVEEGAEALNKLEKLITEKGYNPPTFKMIITGNNPYGYRRKDGIYQIPIGCLKN
ncbi:ATP-binding protein [Gallibacter intestinalis]|uniref:ATP-binding protein n=1 Tax=Gallibacter intestinalis TaxID=2779356 RepID=A0ABR9QV67_9FIRM|nr:DUF4143 domain-containing protein [Gallibacter intestinalis]MBE5034766.1 ATP-binding protein [Gallibacter intestinalis]